MQFMQSEKIYIFQNKCRNWLPPGWELRKWQEEFLQRCYMSMIQQINKPKEDINPLFFMLSLDQVKL